MVALVGRRQRTVRMLTFLKLSGGIGVAALFLAALGYSWARDPVIRRRATERNRPTLAPDDPASRAEATFEGAPHFSLTQGLLLAKLRRPMLIIGTGACLITVAGFLLIAT